MVTLVLALVAIPNLLSGSRPVSPARLEPFPGGLHGLALSVVPYSLDLLGVASGT
jgi:hypothetical protein